MSISLNIPTTSRHLSFSKTISPPPIANPFLWLSFSNLSLNPKNKNRSSVIRMGGGPRTYPGGVSKWQWKRMQAKKAKQLLKARLARERHIYQMRKRAELKAAVSELERPWEPVHKPPTLFSVSADEQLKVLADRFQKPGGLDLWSDRDGPQLFRTVDGVPSARFFPKGVVHSVKPYGKVSSLLGEESDEDEEGFGVGVGASKETWENESVGRSGGEWGKKKNGRGIRKNVGDLGEKEAETREEGPVIGSRSRNARMDSRDSGPDHDQSYRVNRGRNTTRSRNARVVMDSRDSGPDRDQHYRVNRGRNTTRSRNARVVMDSRDSGPDRDQHYRVNRGRNTSRIRNGKRGMGHHALWDSRDSLSDGEVYDMLLGKDGSYGLEA